MRVNAFINQRLLDYRGKLFADIDAIAPGDDVNISSCRPGNVSFERHQLATESKNRIDSLSNPRDIEGNVLSWHCKLPVNVG